MRSISAAFLWISSAFCLLAAPVAAQQGVITGRVTDAESMAPLSDALVSVVGAGATTLTNPQGQYRVEVDPGTYAVAVSLIGYADRRIENVSVAGGSTTTVDILLESRALVLNPIVVSGRQEEKALESPSTIVTVGSERIEERVTTSSIDHLSGVPGVDISRTGLTQANVVTRGFNNIFSGALLVITDNRYASVPSLRFNAYNMIPTTQLDLDRIEVLLGPAAALYGPNASSGVLHLITKSPLDEQRSAVSLSTGERDVFQGVVSTSFKTSENTGLRVSAEYLTGTDWRFTDPVEAEARQEAIDGGADPDELLVGARDFTSEKWSVDARFDARIGDDAELLFNAGANTLLSSVELTGVGGGQARDWRYSYVQTRFRTGRLFAQAFLNKSDAGDTYLLRTGAPIVDESELWVGQLQHGLGIGESQDFIYGLDVQLTRPKTGGTITGRNEDDDDINEVGVYLQSTTNLSDRFDLIAALRYDEHNRLEDPNLSPRAALVFRPAEDQNFRFTYNRSFSTPTTNNLFIDLVASTNPFRTGADIRLLGVPESGFTFDSSCPGGIIQQCMISPFVPGNAIPSNALPFWDGLMTALAQADPTFATVARALMMPGAAPGDPDLANALLRFNQELAAVEGEFPFLPDEGPTPIGDIQPTIHNTLEVGYKGILGGKLLVNADLYQDRIEDFVGPLRTETPTVHFSLPSVADFVQHRLAPFIQGGLVTPEQLQDIIGAIAAIPVGTIAPDQSQTPDLLLTYRNFGDVDLWGGDLAFQFLATNRLSFTGSYSYVSEDCFDFDEDETCFSAVDVALNAPQHKGSLGVRWDDQVSGLTFETRARFVDRFPMNSGVYIGEVAGYGTVDLNGRYRIASMPGASVGVAAYNVFDNEHNEFVGAPEIGRMLLLRLMYEF